MMLLCCSVASACFTSRNPSSLSVDCFILKYVRSAEPHWLRLHLVACPRNDFRRKTLGQGCTMPLEFFWLVLSPVYPVPSLPALPCCIFLETLLVATACSCYFPCQAWKTWACFLAFVQRACCHTGAPRCSGGQLWLSLPVLRSLHCWCDRVFRPPDRQCSHLGPLVLFCKADTLQDPDLFSASVGASFLTVALTFRFSMHHMSGCCDSHSDHLHHCLLGAALTCRIASVYCLSYWACDYMKLWPDARELLWIYLLFIQLTWSATYQLAFAIRKQVSTDCARN